MLEIYRVFKYSRFGGLFSLWISEKRKPTPASISYQSEIHRQRWHGL